MFRTQGIKYINNRNFLILKLQCRPLLSRTSLSLSKSSLNKSTSSRLRRQLKNDQMKSKELEKFPTEQVIDKECCTVNSEDTGKDIESEIDGIRFITGRYVMVQSKNFDEYMKALGVGLVKRKMANSLIPVNDIAFDEDSDTFTIRTETTFTTTEISFRLGESFIESTLDGRQTLTTAHMSSPTTLVLIQEGHKCNL